MLPVRGTAKERNWKTSNEKEVFPCTQFSFSPLVFQLQKACKREREQRRRSHIIFHYLKPERTTTDDDDWARKRRAENSCTFDSMSGTEYNNEKVYPLFLRAASLCKWKIIVLCTREKFSTLEHGRVKQKTALDYAISCTYAWAGRWASQMAYKTRWGNFPGISRPGLTKYCTATADDISMEEEFFSEKFFSRVFKDGKESF